MLTDKLGVISADDGARANEHEANQEVELATDARALGFARPAWLVLSRRWQSGLPRREAVGQCTVASATGCQ